MLIKTIFGAVVLVYFIYKIYKLRTAKVIMPPAVSVHLLLFIFSVLLLCTKLSLVNIIWMLPTACILGIVLLLSTAYQRLLFVLCFWIQE